MSDTVPPSFAISLAVPASVSFLPPRLSPLSPNALSFYISLSVWLSSNIFRHEKIHFLCGEVK